VKHHDGSDVLRSEALALGVPLSPAQARTLLTFERLLVERAVPAGMVAQSDVERMHQRHILDCLRAAAVIRPEDRLAYDLGSGAGLPGLIVAIAVPHLQVALVETRQRRVAFLELAVEKLSLSNAAVRSGRIEELTGEADLCLARALAPPARVWSMAERLLRPNGRLVYFAGEGAHAPVEVPGVRRITVVGASVLESARPLVIMAR
jgi:16S rRNA (guanine527-N7)-methyltransferase